MKIVLTRSMVPGDIQYIKNGLDREIIGEYEFIVPSEFTEDGICAVAADADVLLGPYVTKKILETAKRIKLIQVPWTGMDTFDFNSVQGCTVPVCNTHSNADSVAEIGVAMVLDLLKKVSYHDRKMRSGNWNRDQKPLNLKSKMLNKQTVCILGFGNIGSRIGKLISVFGAKVIAVGGHIKPGETVEEVYPKKQIKDAVAKADVIVCTLPLTESTRDMINDEMFGVMKDGVVFVNLSRAAIVDEDAAWNALESGKLGAFGSDVWWNVPKRGETESYPSVKHEFWNLDNVLMSPHRAGFIEDSLPHLDGAIENIIALAKGRELKGIVDLAKGF
ncbi:MAG: 2-hydroxyacid dehydrogenase [Blautia sp.]